MVAELTRLNANLHKGSKELDWNAIASAPRELEDRVSATVFTVEGNLEMRICQKGKHATVRGREESSKDLVSLVLEGNRTFTNMLDQI